MRHDAAGLSGKGFGLGVARKLTDLRSVGVERETTTAYQPGTITCVSCVAQLCPRLLHRNPRYQTPPKSSSAGDAMPKAKPETVAHPRSGTVLRSDDFSYSVDQTRLRRPPSRSRSRI